MANTQKNAILCGFAMNYINQDISIIHIYIGHIPIIIKQVKSKQIQQNGCKYLKISKSQTIWLHLCVNICIYHLVFMHYLSIKMRILGARINIICGLNYQFIPNITNPTSHLRSNFMNNIHKQYIYILLSLQNIVLLSTNHHIMAISKLPFYQKLHLSWDIHPTGKGNIVRKKWKTGKCRIFVVHYGRTINTCNNSRFHMPKRT
eukprot:UN09761